MKSVNVISKLGALSFIGLMVLTLATGGTALAADNFKLFQQVKVSEKPAELKRLASFEEAPGCQVVFISNSEEERLSTILDKLRGSPVLTVSDMKKFIQRGGMVGFIVEKNKVGFNINRTVAESAGLKVSSQLLKLAKTIVKTILTKPIG